MLSPTVSSAASTMTSEASMMFAHGFAENLLANISPLLSPRSLYGTPFPSPILASPHFFAAHYDHLLASSAGLTNPRPPVIQAPPTTLKLEAPLPATSASSGVTDEEEREEVVRRPKRGRPQQEIDEDDQDPDSVKRRSRRLYARQYRAEMRKKMEEVKKLEKEIERLKEQHKREISRLQADHHAAIQLFFLSFNTSIFRNKDEVIKSLASLHHQPFNMSS